MGKTVQHIERFAMKPQNSFGLGLLSVFFIHGEEHEERREKKSERCIFS